MNQALYQLNPDDVVARFHFFLGSLAIECAAIDTLFPAEQARRLRSLVEQRLDRPELDGMHIREFRQYTETLKSSHKPLDAAIGRMILKVCADVPEALVYGRPDPMLAMIAAARIVGAVGRWKHIAKHNRLIEA